MTRPNDQTALEERKAELRGLLMRRRRRKKGDKPRPISAYRIALALGIRPGGSRESKRRGARRLIKMMRDEDHPIAHGPAGYWWSETVGDHQAYRRQRRRVAMANLVAEAADRHSPQAAAVAGQMGLFGEGGPTIENPSTAVQTAVECG